MNPTTDKRAIKRLIKKTNEIETKTESRFDRVLEELKRDREEQSRKWDEQNKKWEENQKENREFYDTLDEKRKESNREFNIALEALEARWGFRSESSFHNTLKGILAGLDFKVEHIDDYDEEGMVYGQPSSVEIDVIIKNGLLMICELKSSISKADMFIFYKKTLFYEKKYHRKGDRLIVISPMVEIKAGEAAEELGIKVFSYAEDIQEEL